MNIQQIFQTYLLQGYTCSGVSAEGAPQIKELFCILARIINILLGVGGLVALIFLAVGGVQYMVSGGDEKALSTAKGTITYSILGLLIILTSIVAINIITGSIFGVR